jgi:amino acid transporter
MTVTYIFFYRACKAQGLDRSTLPYYARFQPYCAWIGLIWMTMVVFCYGYSSLNPFSVTNFFIYYAMVIREYPSDPYVHDVPLTYCSQVAIVTFFGWKIFKRTRFIGANEADLVWERPTIDAYEVRYLRVKHFLLVRRIADFYAFRLLSSMSQWVSGLKCYSWWA